jgi:hypothetical protein
MITIMICLGIIVGALIIWFILALLTGFLEFMDVINSSAFGLAAGFWLYLSHRVLDNFVPFEIHPVFCILGAIAVFALTFFLQKTTVGFWIFAAIMSPFWAAIPTFVISRLIEDPIWTWSVFAALTLINIGAHIRAKKHISERGLGKQHINVTLVSESDSGERSAVEKLAINPAPAGNTGTTKKYQKLLTRFEKVSGNFKQVAEVAGDFCNNNENSPHEHFFASTIDKYNEAAERAAAYFEEIEGITSSVEHNVTIKAIEKYLGLAESYHKEIQDKLNELLIRKSEKSEKDSSNGFSLFAGCGTIEQLKKRYKELSKNYHPDTDSGDKEAMQKINQEYNRLLEDFKQTV